MHHVTYNRRFNCSTLQNGSCSGIFAATNVLKPSHHTKQSNHAMLRPALSYDSLVWPRSFSKRDGRPRVSILRPLNGLRRAAAEGCSAVVGAATASTIRVSGSDAGSSGTTAEMSDGCGVYRSPLPPVTTTARVWWCFDPSEHNSGHLSDLVSDR